MGCGLGISLLAVPFQVRERPLSSLGARGAAGSAAAAVGRPFVSVLPFLWGLAGCWRHSALISPGQFATTKYIAGKHLRSPAATGWYCVACRSTCTVFWAALLDLLYFFKSEGCTAWA